LYFRRTKKQVAADLPDKTEIIIYCEMGIEQRKVYDAYEKEFRNYLLHQPEVDLLRESMQCTEGLYQTTANMQLPCPVKR
jgi:SNF2 family DNA or RNA helicase